MNSIPTGYVHWKRTDKGVAFCCPSKDKIIEIEEKALSEEIREAIKDGHDIWINDYVMDNEGNCEFEFKVYLPN